MKIRLSIYMKDKIYAERLFSYFDENYGEGLELSLFSEYETFKSALEETVIDILLTEESLEQEIADIVKNQTIHIAYMTEKKEKREDEKHYIYKYQQVKQIYKEIEKICAENNMNIAFAPRGEDAYIYTFMSAGGGAGATTVAHAAAMRLAKKRKVLYLSLECYGTTKVYFESNGEANFDSVISALNNRNFNLETMLRSVVRENQEGVHYYEQSQHPADMVDLNKERIGRLLYTLKKQLDYEYIFVDVDRIIDEKLAEVLRFSNQLVLVCDGTDVGREKFSRIYKGLEALENQEKIDVLSRTSIIYNKFRSKEGIKGSRVNEKGIVDLGALPYYCDMLTQKIICEMAKDKKLETFDRG